MTWKLKLVLLFARLNKPIEADGGDIYRIRAKATQAGRLGSLIFDRKVKVATITDLTAGDIPLRIYSNSATAGQRVIIYYHGGGFVLYGLGSHDYICRRLCAMNGCIVVAVDYRLAPEHTFPAAHDDAFQALQWVRGHIPAHGGDPNDIVVAGDSAGGNLSACMAHRCKKENISLTAQVLIYPWIDGRLVNPSITRNGHGYMLTHETTLWFQRQYTPRPEDHCDPAISPCFEADHTRLAPAYILTAQYDPLIDDGYKYYEQLKAAGNKAIYKEYKDQIHGFINIPRVDPIAMQAFTDIRDFLKTV